MSRSLDAQLNRLERAKNSFGRGAAAHTKRLLTQFSKLEFHDPRSLLRFHECLLFLRAFPQSASLVPQTERILDEFHLRIKRLQEKGADMEILDDFDTSGVAGTTMQDTLNFEAARWLVQAMPRNVEIAWDDYQEDFLAERAMGTTWPRFIPLLAEDADVEANIPWRRWLDAARGRERALEWFIRQFENLPLPERPRAELYDSLRLPIRWHLANLKLSRTRNWSRPRRLYVHDGPLIPRRQVSLERELDQPLRLAKLSLREGEAVIRAIREAMLVRYRELYGTTLGDPHSVVRADVGRGVVIHLWNLPPQRRLPLRAYVAGFTLKNGVPINYIEAIGLCEWIEVGFNTFYTYRQGETAWIYAQALRCLRAFTGARTISVYPYQIGHNNDEALDSGAFWFYRKLGFRCGRPDLEQLARREEQKIAANPQYRTPRRTLKRLAEAHVFYEIATAPANANGIEAGAMAKGPWDKFSTRNIALRVNRRMAREFDGDCGALRKDSIETVARILRINPERWTPGERRSLEDWSLLLALVSDLRDWSPQEKRHLIKIIRTQSGRNEMRYLKLTQTHARLRRELQRLGQSSDVST